MTKHLSKQQLRLQSRWKAHEESLKSLDKRGRRRGAGGTSAGSIHRPGSMNPKKGSSLPAQHK
jgi:hypothetical protein